MLPQFYLDPRNQVWIQSLLALNALSLHAILFSLISGIQLISHSESLHHIYTFKTQPDTNRVRCIARFQTQLCPRLCFKVVFVALLFHISFFAASFFWLLGLCLIYGQYVLQNQLGPLHKSVYCIEFLNIQIFYYYPPMSFVIEFISWWLNWFF